jgi:hypothetical protein
LSSFRLTTNYNLYLMLLFCDIVFFIFIVIATIIIIIIIVNIWGFERILHGCGKGGYSHQHFIRGEEYLCNHMERQKIKGKGLADNSSTTATATATATAVICSPQNNDTTNDLLVLSPCDKSYGGDSPRRVSTQQHQQNSSNDTAPPGIPMLPLLCLDFDTIMDIPSPTPILSSSPKSNNKNDNNTDGYSSTASCNGNNNVCGGGGGTSPRSVKAFPPFMNIESCDKTITTSEVKPIFQQRCSPPRPTMKYYGNNSNNSNNNSKSSSKINTFTIDDEMIDDMLTNSYQQEDNSDDGGFFEGKHFFFLHEHVTSSFPKRRVNRVSLSS